MLRINKTMMLRYFIIFLVFVSFNLRAQNGGENVYEFTELANSARISALGSNFISVTNSDVSLAYSNPSLINSDMHNQLSFSYLNYFSDISTGVAAYAYNIDKIGTLAATMQFINYGNFTETDHIGNQAGEFTAGEYALILGWSKPIAERLRLGVNLKNIYSSFYDYKSYGIAADLAATYYSEDELFSSSIALKNIGRQISYYSSYGNEPIGFNIQAALSKKFEHAPFRLHFILNNLNRWNLRYELEDESSNPFGTEENEADKMAVFADNAMRHLIAGIEFAPGKGNFNVQFAYNYKRRQEMKIASRTAMVGFSFGVGLKVSKFKISYGRAVYHLAGSSNHFTISTNLNEFLKN